MLRCILCDVQTTHRAGFVFRAANAPHYLFLYFHTPFFCEINGTRIQGRAGQCLLQRPGETVVHGPLHAQEQFVNDWIYFDGTAQEIRGLELPFDTLLTPQAGDLISGLIGQIRKESVNTDAFSARLISDSIYHLLVLVKRAESVQCNTDAPLLAHFKEVRLRILQSLSQPWTLCTMAELSGYSVSRFCALYTAFFGISPMNDLLERRLEAAKQLLSLHAYKVVDVAALCGFSSIHYFSNFFKKRVGVSPALYAQTLT